MTVGTCVCAIVALFAVRLCEMFPAPRLALAGEPHLAVVLLVVQEVHYVVVQLATVTTDQNIGVA